MLYSLLLLIIVFFVLFKSKENFEVVGYNTLNIPNYVIKNSYDTESIAIQSLFNKVFKDHFIDTKSFTLYSNYIEFPFNNIIKTFMANYLTSILNDKIQVNTNLTNMYWKDDEKDRLFIFNIDMVNHKHFTTRKLKVKIKIHDILNFVKGNNSQDYQNDIKPEILIKSIDILSISLDSDNYEKSTLIGIDKLQPRFYVIKNNLFLMDPFLTSRKDNVITKTMKDNFALSLIQHQKLADANKKSLH